MAPLPPNHPHGPIELVRTRTNPSLYKVCPKFHEDRIILERNCRYIAIKLIAIKFFAATLYTSKRIELLIGG